MRAWAGADTVWAKSAPRAAGDFIFSRLTLAGTSSMVTDGVESNKTFVYTAPARGATIQRVLIEILDTSADPTDFGGIASLGTGLEVCALASDASTRLIRFDGGTNIARNADWAVLAGVDTQLDGGAGTDMVLIRWTIANAGAPLSLTSGQQLAFIIKDDLTGLVDFQAMVQGTLNG